MVDDRVKLTREGIKMSDVNFDACASWYGNVQRERAKFTKRDKMKSGGLVKRWSWVTNSRGRRVRRKTWGKPGPPPSRGEDKMVAFNTFDQWRLHRAAGVRDKAAWDRLDSETQSTAHSKACNDGLGSFSVVDGRRHMCRG